MNWNIGLYSLISCLSARIKQLFADKIRAARSCEMSLSASPAPLPGVIIIQLAAFRIYCARRVKCCWALYLLLCGRRALEIGFVCRKARASYLWSEEIVGEGAQNAAEITLNDHFRRVHIICLRHCVNFNCAFSDPFVLYYFTRHVCGQAPGERPNSCAACLKSVRCHQRNWWPFVSPKAALWLGLPQLATRKYSFINTNFSKMTQRHSNYYFLGPQLSNEQNWYAYFFNKIYWRPFRNSLLFSIQFQ